MLLFSKRRRIVRKAIKKTVAAFSGRSPKIYEHFFYGAVEIGPHNLVVWYLFETDAQLETARSSGLCRELEDLTVQNLIALGYPQEAFMPIKVDIPTENIFFEGVSEENRQAILESLKNRTRKAMVSFTTKEDIDKKANGDYRLYFQ